MSEQAHKKSLCPLCGKDMTIRPGAVFRCDRDVCAYWRMGHSRDQIIHHLIGEKSQG